MPAHFYRFAPVGGPPDPRRTITEAELPKEAMHGIARMTKLQIHPTLGEGPAVLGNHYHRKDRERFILVDGFGVLLTQEIDGDLRTVSDLQVEFVGPDTVIVMEPFTVHTFIFDTPAVMFCASTCAFDPNDMPRHPLQEAGASPRAVLNLQAMAQHAGGKQEAESLKDIFCTFPNGVVVDLAIEESALTINGHYRPFTTDTLGKVLAEVQRLAGL